MLVKTRVQWEERYILGIPRLDEQHKKIVNLLDQIVQLDFPDADHPEMHVILGKMTDYFLEHIRYEEAYMKKINHPDFKEHKQQHDEFIAQVSRFSMDALQEKPRLGVEIALFLEEWIRRHMLEEDMKLKR